MMHGQTKIKIAGLVYACTCLFTFIVIYSYGQTVQYVEFLRFIWSVESGAPKAGYVVTVREMDGQKVWIIHLGVLDSV